MIGAEGLDGVATRLAAVDGVRIDRNAPAGEFCTYRVGGPLAVVAHVESTAGLAGLAADTSRTDVPTVVIGRGSNLLVADAGFSGVAIVLGDAFAEFEIVGTILRTGAAAPLPVVARATVAAGLTGFEWAVGVPGSIGGAVRMNAGGHGSDMAASLVSVEVADLSRGELAVRSAAELDLGYRHSNLASSDVVAGATIELEVGDVIAGSEILAEIVAWRRAHQPGGPNAGSVFTNPKDMSAGELIDSAGGKGRRIGTAEVSSKHANFIQVDAGGSADDVVALMADIVDLVARTHGVRLSAETRLVGFDEGVVARVQPVAAGGDETEDGR